MQMQPLRIVPVRDARRHIAALARWHFGMWGGLNPTNDIPARVERLERHAASDGIPTTFVALRGEKLAGSASLVERDLPSRADVGPWLASVFVAPELRRQGVGSALVDHAVRRANELGVTELYLFTPDQMTLYSSLGWEAIDWVEYGGEVQTVMSISPSARAAELSAR